MRFGGLYALERLAQDNTEQRETIVAVWCAYLRMPFTPDDDTVREEREVRIAVQRLLARHLRPGDRFWPGMNIDLTGATLVKLNFEGCHLDVAQFREATFVGPAMFQRTAFSGSAGFSRATFRDDAHFQHVTFHGNAPFRHTTFTQGVDFTGTTFGGSANFARASFTGPAGFERVTFTLDPVFRDATFLDGDGPPPS